MKREKARALLPDYLNDHLHGRPRERLAALLRADEELRREAEEMRREFSLLRESLSDPEESAHLNSISRRVTDYLRNDRAAAPGAAWIRVLAAAAALAVFAVILILYQPAQQVSVEVKPLVTAAAEQTNPVENRPTEELSPAPKEEQTASVPEAVSTPAAKSGSPAPRSINMTFATSNPKVKIYWTFSRDFDPNLIGE